LNVLETKPKIYIFFIFETIDFVDLLFV